MRSLKVLGIVGFAAAMTGCVPEWARENETGIIMEVAGITGEPGAPGIEAGDILHSDVTPVFNDNAIVTVNVYRKNPNVDATSPLEHVRLESYQVRFFRTDGHSVEGVDVPHRITGPLNSLRFHTPTGTGELEIDAVVTVVRHQAKLEPPLVNLTAFLISDTTGTPLLAGQGIISAVAEITIYARQVTTGEPLSASGRMQVTFANFANE